ncbi:MAG: diguanylate cyclase domain-containing protein [Cellvibrionaceae bacterium]
MGTSTKKTTTVLLVDDDRQEYLLIGYLLSEAHGEDYRLVWCQHLDQALDHIERKACDVVLLDYNWGGSSIGQDFLSNARSKNSHIPIIVMTDEMEEKVDQRAIREGASDYLTKSRINSQLLERAIRYAIERKQIEDRLDHLAHYDHLTDLPNRSLFLDRLRHSINLAERDKNQFTLLFIDLNDFKGINDSYGHDTGDKLLKQFSERLQKSIRRSDTVARIGGDEFTVILHNVGNSQKIMMLAQKIINDANEPYTINEHQFNVGCSVGIATYPDSGRDEETLQRNADLAMYQAKQSDVSSYRFYTDALTDEIKVQWDLLRDFYSGMQEKQFGVFYIPRVDLRNKKIAAVEIAPYWKHPHKGVLHYHQFSSINSDKEMAHKLSEWLLSVGLYQFSKLSEHQDLTLVFNFEPQYFSSKGFALNLNALLDKYNINGERIEFDLNQIISESNLDIIESCMDNLRALGISFGINGFGSGLSSLLDLQRLPINTLKLDKRFIKTIHKNTEDARLCKAVINFAHSIDKKVVADGVKTALQHSMLQKLGCDQSKGPAAMEILSFKQLHQKLTLQKNKKTLDN